MAAEGGLPRRKGTPIQAARSVISGLFWCALTSRLSACFARRPIERPPPFASVSSVAPVNPFPPSPSVGVYNPAWVRERPDTRESRSSSWGPRYSWQHSSGCRIRLARPPRSKWRRSNRTGAEPRTPYRHFAGERQLQRVECGVEVHHRECVRGAHLPDCRQSGLGDHRALRHHCSRPRGHAGPAAPSDVENPARGAIQAGRAL